MTNYFMYSYNKTSPKKILLSLMPTVYQDNSVEDPSSRTDEIINDNECIKQMEALIQSELLAREKYEVKIDKLNEIVEENMNVIRDIEMLVSEIEVKNEDRENKLKEIIDEKNHALERIGKYRIDLDELVLGIDTRMEDVELGLQCELEDIKRLIKKEIRKALQELRKKHKTDFQNFLCGWLWKQVIIRINGFDIQGVLTEVSVEHIILVVSEDIFIIPIKNIDFVKRHA